TPIAVPFQTPLVIVPRLVMFPCTTVGNVDDIDGTPPPSVTNTPLFPVAIDERVSAAVVYRIVLTPPNVVTPVPPCATVNVPVTSLPPNPTALDDKTPDALLWMIPAPNPNKSMFPVEVEPSVNVCLLVVARLPLPVIYV